MSCRLYRGLYSLQKPPDLVMASKAASSGPSLTMSTPSNVSSKILDLTTYIWNPKVGLAPFYLFLAWMSLCCICSWSYIVNLSNVSSWLYIVNLFNVSVSNSELHYVVIFLWLIHLALIYFCQSISFWLTENITFQQSVLLFHDDIVKVLWMSFQNLSLYVLLFMQYM